MKTIITVWYWSADTKGQLPGDPGVYALKDFETASDAQGWMHGNASRIKVKRVTQGDFVFKTELVARPVGN